MRSWRRSGWLLFNANNFLLVQWILPTVAVSRQPSPGFPYLWGFTTSLSHKPTFRQRFPRLLPSADRWASSRWWDVSPVYRKGARRNSCNMFMSMLVRTYASLGTMLNHRSAPYKAHQNKTISHSVLSSTLFWDSPWTYFCDSIILSSISWNKPAYC